ncbi:ThiF family adenylyltransferase [Streptococcus sp. k-628]|uniref:HesA/MoeB/ThiF family protein n=1 Tax=Streptococcus sp. k-628 TaxID=2582635 RepID=UPI0015636216|nr:ThiF family adenylyltransferase [Streptococcus sp. k-628]
MRKPYFKKQLALIPYENKLSIGSTPGFALEISDDDHLVYNILKLCDGFHSEEDIADLLSVDFPTITIREVSEILSELENYPVVLEDFELTLNSELTPNQIERHSRTMNFLSNFDASGNHKIDYMKKIIDSNVLVIGLGGVGSSLVMNLSALGVGTIIGVDFDSVDLSNLNRQILYNESDIGKLKSECATNKISEFDSSIKFITYQLKVTSPADVEKLINDHEIDFVFCAADQPSIWIYKWINEACFKTGVAWLYGGNSEASSYFQTIIPEESSCFNCRELNLKMKSSEGFVKYNEVLKNGYATQNNCLAATSSCITSFMIFDFIRFITDIEKPRVLNKILTIDYRDYDISYESIETNQDCFCCHHVPGEGR